jgi:hypothetical protein
MVVTATFAEEPRWGRTLPGPNALEQLLDPEFLPGDSNED